MKKDPTVREVWASIPNELIEYVYLFIGEAVDPSPSTLRYGLCPVMPTWWSDLNEDQKKVISFIRRRAFSEYLKEKRPVYAYTINYKTGNITERYGCIYLYATTPCGGHKFQDYNSEKYLTNCSDVEGVVRGDTVWYKEPSMDKAEKAFLEKHKT